MSTAKKETSLQYKFKEDEIIREIKEYIDKTYSQHYSLLDNKEKIQVTEFMMSHFVDGEDFLRGNALKYLCRYGLKDGKNRKDLLKAVHYIILMMYYNDNSK